MLGCLAARERQKGGGGGGGGYIQGGGQKGVCGANKFVGEWGAGFRVQGLGCKVSGSGFRNRVWGAEFEYRLWGAGFRIQGLEFRFQGFPASNKGGYINHSLRKKAHAKSNSKLMKKKNRAAI